MSRTAHALAPPLEPTLEPVPAPPADEMAGLVRALELRHLSDGRLFDPRLVAGEIYHYLQQGVRCAYEIGRRLLWAKEVLPHGQFQAWVQEHVPFIKERACRNYMQTADFLLANPRLLNTAESVGIHKTLLLAQLPPDELDELTQGGRVADVDLEAMKAIPYPELKKRWKAAESKAKELEEDLEKEQKRAANAEATLNNIVEVRHSPDDDAHLARLAQWRKSFDGAMALMGLGLDAFAARLAEGSLSPRVQSEVLGLVEYVSTYAEYEALRFRKLSGGDVIDYQLDEALSRPRPAAERFRLPAGRILDPMDGPPTTPPAPADAPAADQPAPKRTQRLRVASDDGDNW